MNGSQNAAPWEVVLIKHGRGWDRGRLKGFGQPRVLHDAEQKDEHFCLRCPGLVTLTSRILAPW